MFERDELFRLLVSSVQDYAIFMLDPTGRISTWNAGAERFKGYTADEIVGKHFSIFYLPEEIAAGKCEMELRVAASVGRFEDEGWRLRKDGSRFWANVVISAMREASGELIGFSKITRDLTERRRAEEERAARLAAEQANRTKDEFLAILGHELRNPLAPIVTALDLLRMRGGELTKEHKIIERQVDHMVRLVDDLLDVSRIARGKIELRRRTVDVRDAVQKAIEIASPLIEERRHHFTSNLSSTELLIDGDEARLIQVFANLLTNAAKYTDPGGQISISAGPHDGRIRVEVRDNGIGIEPELLPQVFNLFVQGTQSVDRGGRGGLGLGLALVKALAELHGGTVKLASEGLGRGTTSTIDLPAFVETTDERTTQRTTPLLRAVTNPLKVLLVDDNDDACFLLGELVTNAGHEVRTALDGAAALGMLESFTPDVAILDLGLPVMDGFELAVRMRAALGPDLRLIALSGYGTENDRVRSAAAGFDQHLVKPVDLSALLAVLQS
ncbi:MAG TPA: ATP-binding protein [Kofleriaceae bacterium]|jgi:PAS domain S-box-containing protein